MQFSYPLIGGGTGYIEATPFYVLRNPELDSDKFSWWSTQPLRRTPSGGASQSDPERLGPDYAALVHRVNSDAAERWLMHDGNGWVLYTCPKEDKALYRKVVYDRHGKIDPERSTTWKKNYLRATLLDWPHVAMGGDGYPGGKNNYLLAEKFGSVYRVFGIPEDCDLEQITPQSHPFWFHRAWIWYGDEQKGRFGKPKCGDAWEIIKGDWFIHADALAPCAAEEMYTDPPADRMVFVWPLSVIRQGPSDDAQKIRRVGLIGFYAVVIEDRGDWIHIPEGWVRSHD